MTRASFRWTAERDGNIGIVTEYRPNGDTAQWRIPSFLVPTFIAGRRSLIGWKMRHQMGAEQVPDHDYEYLKQEPSREPASRTGLDDKHRRAWGIETPDDA